MRVVNGEFISPDEPHASNLAFQLLSSREQQPLVVQSSAFQSGAPIPTTFAVEGGNISPPIKWTGGPRGTKSYAIIMENPDVAQNPPPTDPAHRYYIQIFALDTKLNLPVGAIREELLKAMQGHVLTNGYIIGLYDR